MLIITSLSVLGFLVLVNNDPLKKKLQICSVKPLLSQHFFHNIDSNLCDAVDPNNSVSPFVCQNDFVLDSNNFIIGCFNLPPNTFRHRGIFAMLDFHSGLFE